MQACGSSDGLLPQVFVEDDFSTMLAFDVEDIAPLQVSGLIDFSMRVLAFRRVLIVLPDLLDQMQRHPPLTEQQIVQVSQREQVVFQHGNGFPKS